MESGRHGDETLLRRFRQHQERRHLASGTIVRQRRILDAVAVGLDGGGGLLAASRDSIEDWLDSRAIGARSRYVYLSTLTSFYEWAHEDGLIDANPARRIPRPRLPSLVPRPLGEHEFLVAVRGADPRMRAWLMLGAYQGLRCQEIAGVRTEDLLLDRDPPLLIVSHPKGGRERILPLSREVARALHVGGIPARGYLFSLNDGRPLKAGTVSSYINRYLRSVGLKASAHQLRHLFGTSLYARTKDIRVTQEMLGHADPKTTAIYVTFSHRAAAEAMRDFAYQPDSPLHPAPVS